MKHYILSIVKAKEEEQLAASADAVFPVILQILENCIFNAKDPIVLGCSVEEGIAKVPAFVQGHSQVLFESGSLCVL